MAVINALQTSAIFAFLASIASAKTVTCNHGVNNANGQPVTCTGSITGQSDEPYFADYTPVLHANFMTYGQDKNIDPSTCYFDTYPDSAAPTGRILIGGAMTPWPGSDNTPNSAREPHGASLKYSWYLPNTDITFNGYLDGFGNYKLCTVDITGWWETSVDCVC